MLDTSFLQEIQGTKSSGEYEQPKLAHHMLIEGGVAEMLEWSSVRQVSDLFVITRQEIRTRVKGKLYSLMNQFITKFSKAGRAHQKLCDFTLTPSVSLVNWKSRLQGLMDKIGW